MYHTWLKKSQGLEEQKMKQYLGNMTKARKRGKRRANKQQTTSGWKAWQATLTQHHIYNQVDHFYDMYYRFIWYTRSCTKLDFWINESSLDRNVGYYHVAGIMDITQHQWHVSDMMARGFKARIFRPRNASSNVHIDVHIMFLIYYITIIH